MAHNENYRTDPQPAIAGMIADQSANCLIISRTVETAAIGFAKCVKQGSEDHGVELVESGDTAILGITVRNQAVEAGSVDEYPVGDTASILLKGAIFVVAGGTVSAGDPVHVTVDGSVFTTGAGAGKVAIANAVYETSGTASSIVRVRLI